MFSSNFMMCRKAAAPRGLRRLQMKPMTRGLCTAVLEDKVQMARLRLSSKQLCNHFVEHVMFKAPLDVRRDLHKALYDRLEHKLKLTRNPDALDNMDSAERDRVIEEIDQLDKILTWTHQVLLGEKAYDSEIPVSEYELSKLIRPSTFHEEEELYGHNQIAPDRDHHPSPSVQLASLAVALGILGAFWSFIAWTDPEGNSPYGVRDLPPQTLAAKEGGTPKED